MALDRTVLATGLLWLVVIAIHGLSCAFYAVVAYTYHAVPATTLSADLNSFQLTIDMKYFPVIVAFHAICSALHLVFFLEMGVQSLRLRKWFFHRSNRSSRTTPAPSEHEGPTMIQSVKKSSKVESLRNLSVVPEALRAKTSAVWQSSFGHKGFFGVHGKHFTIIFLTREMTETILQSIQAFKLSYFVPRVWLNRLAVAMVTVGCWSTPMIQRVFRSNPRLELILCLLFDVALDFVSSVGVTTALAVMYWRDYDPMTTTFEISRWYDLAWYAHMTNELRILFIQSWMDFLSRALFAITLLLCLDDVKFLMADPTTAIFRPARAKTESKRVTWNRRIETIGHLVLVAWGGLILGLHSEAAFDTQVPECQVEVRPWLTSKTACAFLVIDCQLHGEMVGSVSELESTWSELDSQFLSLLLLINCPKLSMPPSIQTFTNMVGLYVINVKLEDWSEQAALTKQHHRSLHHFAGIYLDMSKFGNGSSLPPGLVSRDFPPTLRLIFFSDCFLSDLPADLDKSWPANAQLNLPGNAFTTVPEVISRLKPMRLILSRNPLTELPAALFETSSINWLSVDDAGLTHFPANANISSALREISFRNSNITSLPAWMLTKQFVSQVQALGSGTPYCKQLQSDVQSAESVKFVSRYCA